MCIFFKILLYNWRIVITVRAFFFTMNCLNFETKNVYILCLTLHKLKKNVYGRETEKKIRSVGVFKSMMFLKSMMFFKSVMFFFKSVVEKWEKVKKAVIFFKKNYSDKKNHEIISSTEHILSSIFVRAPSYVYLGE